MMKKLTKFGNSRGLILDKAILQMLDITDETELKITVNNNSLVITPLFKQKTTDTKLKDPYLEAIVEQVMKEYESVLKKLANN